MKQKTKASLGRKLTGTLLAGFFLLVGAVALVPSSAVATPPECGTPSTQPTIPVVGGGVRIYFRECTGASVILPPQFICAGVLDREILFVDVVLFDDDTPCTVAGVWIEGS